MSLTLLLDEAKSHEMHGYLLEDDEGREYIEGNKHSKGTRTTAQIQVPSLSVGENISLKVGGGREVHSLHALWIALTWIASILTLGLA